MATVRVVDALLVAGVFAVLMALHPEVVGARAMLLAVVATLLTVVCMESVGLYRRWRGAHFRREIHTILAGWALVVAGVCVVGLGSDALRAIPGDVFVTWLLLSPVAIAAAHVGGRGVLRLARTKGYNKRSAVIAGAGLVGEALARRFAGIPWAGVHARGFFDDDPAKQGRVIQGTPVLGTLDDLPAYAREPGVDMVYLALPMRAEARMRMLMDELSGTNAAVYMVPDIFVFDLLGSKVLDVDGIPVVSLSESPQIGPAGAVKRLEDLLLAGVGLLLLAPVFLALAFLIKRASPGPVFFGHSRLGQNGRKFNCYKFRTMVVDSDRALKELLERDPEARREWEENFKLKDDPRITRIGRFLRKTSLDELPQLWNVLKGEMSLVGPRPIVEDEVRKYGRFYRHLSLVRPGMTGLWQVSGRSDVTYEERVQMDVEYAREWTVWKDLTILGKTVKTVLARAGSY